MLFVLCVANSTNKTQKNKEKWMQIIIGENKMCDIEAGGNIFELVAGSNSYRTWS